MSFRQGRIGVLAAVLTVGLGATSAFASSDTAMGDATAGKNIFKKSCRACHQAEKERNGAGPFLVGIMGREAGSVPKFKYSKAMKESGIVWDAESLAAFVKAPRKFLKGTRMGFRGLKDEAQINDLVTYLTDPSAAQ